MKVVLIQKGKIKYDPAANNEIRKPYIILTKLNLNELHTLYKDIEVLFFWLKILYILGTKKMGIYREI
mgnify:CR=1 FL=1